MAQHNVTAVITTYHRDWEVVRRAVESVLQQTVPVFELLLIDDNGLGSEWQEKIQKGVQAYPQVRYLPMEKNSGVSAARNSAIDAAHGDILGYLDDDDAWCPDKLEKLLPLFEQSPNVALVFGTGWVTEADTGEQLHNWQWKIFKPEPDYADMLYTDYVGSASSPLLKVDALRKLGGFKRQPAVEDYELWINFAQNYELCGIRDIVFLKYNESGEHVSGSLRRIEHGFKNIYKLYRDDYKKYPRAKTAMLWNICRTGVRSFDATVIPYVFAWLLSKFLSKLRRA